MLPLRTMGLENVGDAAPVRIIVALKHEMEASCITKLEQLDSPRTCFVGIGRIGGNEYAISAAQGLRAHVQLATEHVIQAIDVVAMTRQDVAALEPDVTEELAAAPAHVTTDVVEEVFVEAREPRYAAPTLRDRIGRVWVPVMINGKGPFRLVLDSGATTSAIVNSVAEHLGLPVTSTASIRLQAATGAAIVPYVIAERMEVGDLLRGSSQLPHAYVRSSPHGICLIPP